MDIITSITVTEITSADDVVADIAHAPHAELEAMMVELQAHHNQDLTHDGNLTVTDTLSAGELEIGNTIECAVTWYGDYSGDMNSRTTQLHPWLDGTILPTSAVSSLPGGNGNVTWSPNGEFLATTHANSPFATIYQRAGTTFTSFPSSATDTLPSALGEGAAWSPNGEFLAVAHDNSPYITIYQRAGTEFTKLTNPVELPNGNPDGNPSWSPNGEFLATGTFSTPYLAVYRRSGTTFTKLPDPAELPAGSVKTTAWSPNGEFLAVGHIGSPYITIYQRSGVGELTTLTKVSGITAATGTGLSLGWSPSGEFVTLGHNASPNITNYQRAGTTFTKLANPAELPGADGLAVAWFPNGEFLAVGHEGTPWVTIYQRAGTTFTKITNLASLPGNTVYGLEWSPNGEFLAIIYSVAPYIKIYQTSGIIPEYGFMKILSNSKEAS